MGRIFDDIGGWPTVIAIIIPTLAFSSRRFAEFYARYRVLGFGARRLDVVLPASNPVSDQRAGIARPTTGMGSVRAFGTIARAVGRYYRNLPLNVQLASSIQVRLDADLVSVGGPGANRVTAEILRSKPLAEKPIKFDELTRSIDAPGLSISNFDLEVSEGYPGRDLGLLLICPNPFGSKDGRSIVCCGFTSYGTAGIAQWFFEDVLRDVRLRPWSRPFGMRTTRLRDVEYFFALIDVYLSGGNVIGTSVRITKRVQVSHLRTQESSDEYGTPGLESQ